MQRSDGSREELEGLAITWRTKYKFSAANMPFFFLFFFTDIYFFHTLRHVYRSVWPVREAKPRFGVALVRSAHDYGARLLSILLTVSFVFRDTKASSSKSNQGLDKSDIKS